MATDPRYTKSAREGGISRPQTFGDAFREARSAGDATFEFQGKTYTTKTAEEQGRKIGATAGGSGRGLAAGRTASDRDTAPMRAAPTPSLRSMLGREEAVTPTAQETMSRIAGRQPAKSPEQERDIAKDQTLEALGLLAGGGMGAGLRALAGRMARRATPAPAATSRGALVREAEDVPTFKKGGKTKAYAKGGSVRGGGCETRIKKTKYV